MNVNFRQQHHRITISKIVPLFHWRLHLPSVLWSNGICHCNVRTPNSVLSSAGLLSWQIYLFVCLFVFLEYVVKKRIQTWSTESMISRYIPKITWLDTDLPPTLGSVLKGSPQSILCPYNLSHCCSFNSYVCLYRMSMQLWHDEFDLKCIYAIP